MWPGDLENSIEVNFEVGKIVLPERKDHII